MLAEVFASFRACWREQLPFARGLVTALSNDAAAVAATPATGAVGDGDAARDELAAQQRRFLSICNCVAAFAGACGPELAPFLVGNANHVEELQIDRNLACWSCHTNSAHRP
jgi:hypothetical protein